MLLNEVAVRKVLSDRLATEKINAPLNLGLSIFGGQRERFRWFRDLVALTNF